MTVLRNYLEEVDLSSELPDGSEFWQPSSIQVYCRMDSTSSGCQLFRDAFPGAPGKNNLGQKFLRYLVPSPWPRASISRIVVCYYSTGHFVSHFKEG